MSQPASTRYQRIKALCLVVFGITLTLCYGTSAAFHGVRVSGEPLTRLQRLDHVGIYLLIAGTYTPIAWGLMRGPWLWGTLTAAWTAAIVCGTRVLCGDLMPMWLSTLTYLVMGWGALFCYNELARTHSHRKLLLLPLGGLFYSVGAVMNLTHWPALVPGVFAAHEIFHFFVITGTTCHVLFMLGVVIPSPEPAALAVRARARASPERTASRHCTRAAARSNCPISPGEPGPTTSPPLALRPEQAMSVATCARRQRRRSRLTPPAPSTLETTAHIFTMPRIFLIRRISSIPNGAKANYLYSLIKLS